MKSKLTLLLLIFALSSFSQSDSLTLNAHYGYSETDVVDSSLVYNAIEVNIHNIDTLNWQLIQLELVEVNSNQLMVRKIIDRNESGTYNVVNTDEVSLVLAVLPKNDYKIYAKVRHVGGVESETLETTLSNE